MAYKNIVITPNNVSNQSFVKQSQFYKGFSTVDNKSKSTKIYDFDLVRQDIMNMFYTKKGERVMNPEFGTVIWELLYEPLTVSVKQAISDDVTRILNFDPRVVPVSIQITEAPSGIMIDTVLYDKLEDMTRSMKLSFDKEVGLIAM